MSYYIKIPSPDLRVTASSPIFQVLLLFLFSGIYAQSAEKSNYWIEQDSLSKNDTVKQDEFVNIGYGPVGKETTTGALSFVKGSELITSPVLDFNNTLMGVVPGLFVLNESGEPGNEEAALRIRGATTFINTDPLIIVDGIPHRNLDRLNAWEIESITILKDASAAIYGMQAGNGVILVTTKSGKAGKPNVSLNMNGGMQQPTIIPEMTDAATYAIMLNEIAYYLDPAGGMNQVYSPTDIESYRDGSDRWNYPDTDWFKEVFKPWSFQHSEHASVSGGGKKMTYFIAIGNWFQDGVYYNSATYFKQQHFRNNIDWSVTDNISLVLSVLGQLENRNYSAVSTDDNFRMLLRGKPNMPAYWPNGDPGPAIDYGHNPVVTTTGATGYDSHRYYGLQTNLRLIVKIPWIKGLTVQGNYSYDPFKVNRDLYQTPWYLYTWDGTTVDENGDPVTVPVKSGLDTTQLSQSMLDYRTATYNAFVTYELNDGQHDINLMVGVENQKNSCKYQYSGSYEKTQHARQGYFGRIRYNFRQKYLAEAVIRVDGSDMFNQRWGVFPGISAGWRITEERFWKDNITLFNDLMFRVSWGRTGNDRLYSTSRYNIQYPFFDLIQNSVLPNPNLSWETVDQINLGIDASLFRSRLILTADYFHNLRTRIPVSRSPDLDLPLENIGKVSHQGIELMTGYSGKSGSVRYEIAANGTYAQNRVLSIDEIPGIPEYQKTIGHPVGSGLYYEAIGIFRDQTDIDTYPHWNGTRPGDVIFRDVNKDGVIDGLDRVRNNKTGLPQLTYGLSGSLSFGNFDMTILVQGSSGAMVYIDPESGSVGNFYEEYATNRWTEENPVSEYPRTWNQDNEYWRSNDNTFWLRKTDYIRLKNFEIGYNLPGSIISIFKLQGLRVYANGWNLFTLNKLKLFDPELGGGNYYPVQRIVNLGLTLKF